MKDAREYTNTTTAGFLTKRMNHFTSNRQKPSINNSKPQYTHQSRSFYYHYYFFLFFFLLKFHRWQHGQGMGVNWEYRNY